MGGRRFALPLFVVLTATGCAALLGYGDAEYVDEPPPQDAGGADAAFDAVSRDGQPDADGSAPDAAPRTCDADDPFDVPPQLVPGINLAATEDEFPRLSADERTMVFSSDRGDGGAVADRIRFFITQRTARDARFDTPEPLPELVVHPRRATHPMLVADGTSLVFASDDTATFTYDLLLARRTDAGTFTRVDAVGTAVNTGAEEFHPFLASDGGELFFTRQASVEPRLQVYRAFGTTDAGVFDQAERVDELVSADSRGDYAPTLSFDGATLYFARDSNPSPGPAGRHIWVTRRSPEDGRFTVPRNVSELNGPGSEVPGWLSPDGCRLYFGSKTSAASPADVYVATRKPRE